MHLHLGIPLSFSTATFAFWTQKSWLLLCIIWLGLAPLAKRVLYKQPLGQRLPYVLPMAAGLYLIFGPSRLPDALDSIAQTIFPVSVPVAFAGLVLVLGGIGFALWARFVLDGNWSGAATLKADHTLTHTGPYRITRHPIYTGILVALVGTALQRGSLASVIGLLLCAGGFWWKLNVEEQLMIQRFGNEYLAYRVRVPALFPFRF